MSVRSGSGVVLIPSKRRGATDASAPLARRSDGGIPAGAPPLARSLMFCAARAAS